MKKRMMGAALAACFTAAMMTGAFAGEVTVEEVLQNYQAAGASVTDMNATVEGVADITLSMPDQDMTMGIKGNMNMDMAVGLNPLTAEVTATMGGEMMGQGGSMDMHVYMVPAEDGAISVYAGMDAGEGTEWALTTIDAETASQLTEMIAQSSASASIADLPISFQLADGTVDINGTECYALVTSLTWEDMLAVYNYALEAVSEMAGEALPADSLPDQETMDMLGSMLGGLVLNLEIDVDTESYLPQCVYLDFEGTDWVSISALVAGMMGMTDEEGNLMSLSLDVNSLYLAYLYDYAPVTVEVPQEVIDSATDMGNAADLTDEAAGMVGELESGLS